MDQGSLLGNNLFAYCFNNPINNFDPSGNSVIIATAAVAAMAQAALTAITVAIAAYVVTSYLVSPEGQATIRWALDAISNLGVSTRSFDSSDSKTKEKEKDITWPSNRKKAQTYYHVTTPENALSIKATGALIGSSYEGGYVFAWKSYPNKYAIKQSGAHNKEYTVISFKTNATFQPDTGITDPKVLKFQPVRSVLRGPVYVWDVQIVG